MLRNQSIDPRIQERNSPALPLFEKTSAEDQSEQAPLTPGGRLIWLRTHRPPSTCNLIAEIARIGREATR